ncbi:aminotransferase class I/II-fold pyridoxal phosphate-dependent enzyme [Yunchengibacter salinarum]|uniref:aminotransferase class I/II-fold pyridoxal phosphate-dependent enzyme n=1 Tax=Yunchengibacter salinarum TaxID=3133399 RepID=UPI0035B62383
MTQSPSKPAGRPNWRQKTKLVRTGSRRSNFGEMSEALYLTSGFAYDSAEEAEARFDGRAEGFTYSRQANPSLAMLEDRMAALEGAEVGRATATGMAAMTAALLCQLKAGDHLVGGRAAFGSCRWLMDNLLPRYGIETTVVDGKDVNAWKAAIRPETRVLFCESPTNPTLELTDLSALAALAHEHDARLVVDNVFASPLYQNPMAFGADVVTYSTTKHIDGQGRCLGGMVLCDAAFDEEHLFPFYRHTGCAMSPFNAWVMLKGLETLAPRVDAMTDNAEHIAKSLAARLKSTRYPGLDTFGQKALADKQMRRGGTLVTFDLPGGRDQAFRFLNHLTVFDISNNLGDSRSIATHPWSTTHKAVAEESRLEQGITPGMIRLSIGLEAVEDLLDDLHTALDAAGLD